VNRSTIIRLAIVVVLLLLLFWGCTRGGIGPKTEVRRTGPQNEGRFEDAPLSGNQGRMEREVDETTSAAEQEKAVIHPTHSSWIDNGVYEVFGEVENIGKATGKNIRTRVIFKNPSWFTRLAVVETPIDRPTLAPGQKSSFRARYSGNPNNVGGYVLMTVTDPPTTGFIETQEGDFQGLTTGTAARSDFIDESESPDSQASTGSKGAGRLEGPNWLLLLLLITGSVWGAFRYNQWR